MSIRQTGAVDRARWHLNGARRAQRIAHLQLRARLAVDREASAAHAADDTQCITDPIVLAGLQAEYEIAHEEAEAARGALLSETQDPLPIDHRTARSAVCVAAGCVSFAEKRLADEMAAQACREELAGCRSEVTAQPAN